MHEFENSVPFIFKSVRVPTCHLTGIDHDSLRVAQVRDRSTDSF